jgi:hypothetical protein
MPVPQPCRPLEDEVKALEAEDQTLRAQAASSTGAALWPAWRTWGGCARNSSANAASWRPASRITRLRCRPISSSSTLLAAERR